MVGIVAASMFAVVAAALTSHVDEAQRRKWTLPTQLARGMSLLIFLIIFFSSPKLH